VNIRLGEFAQAGELNTPLQYVRTEPYIVPKRSLTGDTAERVDTRVLQLLYGFDRNDLPVYVGQLMDVFIQAPPLETDIVQMRTLPRVKAGGRRGAS
jgi:hypothetical protein